jgi:uncharacterized membrane protein
MTLGDKTTSGTVKRFGAIQRLNELREVRQLSSFFTEINDLVLKSIEEEELLSNKLIELEADAGLTIGERLADKLAEIGGSWTFIMIFMSLLTLWIVLNVYWLKSQAYDPYPFILLNLVLSCIAALQAPVIMMSQNRQENKDRSRARSDYLINLKAELEVRSLHAKIDLLMAEQMKHLFEVQQSQLSALDRIEKSLKT